MADDISVAIESFGRVFDRIVSNVETVIQGKRDAIELMVLAMVSEGHVLIEDVPGVGKTQLAKSLARSIEGAFHRVQFTPDLLPSDVTGVSVWDRHAERFDFKPGPIFANIVVGDEINRASPKTQSALLEAMEERQVTSDGVTRTLEPPFMVIATQNPLEHEGTYPLPEAQLDRFMMRIVIGYPSVAGRRRGDGQGRPVGRGLSLGEELHRRLHRGNTAACGRPSRCVAPFRLVPATYLP